MKEFEDLSAVRLRLMRESIVAEISAHPADFARERELRRRQRWGWLLLLSFTLMLTPGLCLLWIYGERLLQIGGRLAQWGQGFAWPLTGMAVVALLLSTELGRSLRTVQRKEFEEWSKL
ncbi:MAG: hypothetical protein LBT32_08570 [Peptococcaceae bacterium]|jgi:hypothetical protein|nr:hypothetical protein [Peptococcaceae bacterium]